jgi:hypothetical protein
MSDCSLEESEFRIETLREILKTHNYKHTAFTLNLMLFVIKYIECVGKDFHFEFIETLYTKYPALEDGFEKIVEMLCDYKEIIYELENL